MITKNKALKFLSVLIALVSLLLAGCGTGGEKDAKEEAAFPTHELNGVIMWGAGGAMDNVSRSITPLAEKHLGKTVVLQNKPGATGAIATQFVHTQKSNGYTLLYGAENPQLYGVLGISKLDYKDFEPITILGRGVAVICVEADSPYKTLEDVVEAAKAAPGKVKFGSTGPGGLPFVVASLLKGVNDTDFNLVPFDGEGPVVTALLGKHVDVTSVGLTAAKEMYKAGKVRPLAVVSNEPVEGLDGIPPISEVYSEYSKYLPWGPFYGVFVNKDTPENIKQTLRDAYQKAFEEEKFQTFLKDFGAVPMGISGEEAKEFMTKWQQVSTYLLYDAGAAKVSPEELGIERIN